VPVIEGKDIVKKECGRDYVGDGSPPWAWRVLIGDGVVISNGVRISDGVVISGGVVIAD
jgi:acetyltransferase-like isoleucine patch superfamily enzyme